MAHFHPATRNIDEIYLYSVDAGLVKPRMTVAKGMLGEWVTMMAYPRRLNHNNLVQGRVVPVSFFPVFSAFLPYFVLTFSTQCV